MRTAILHAACLLLLSAPAAADTLKVPSQFQTIGDAVAAAQDGDTISVAKGTYLETVTLAVANVKMVGKNAVIDAQYADACLTISADGVSVTGFTFVNGTDGVFASGADIEITNCTALSCQDAGIEVEGAPATISKNTASANNSDGIRFLHSLPGDSVVEKNTCDNNLGDGIEVTGDAVVIAKNTCDGNEGNGINVIVASLSLGLGGLPLNQPVLLQKNDCALNEDDGLQVQNSTESVVTIDGNDLSGNADVGLDANGEGFVITKNDCNDNRDSGLALLVGTSTVSKNEASGNGDNGILVFNLLLLDGPADGGAFGSANDNVLEDNVCKDNGGDGIMVLQGVNNTLRSNTCSDNHDDGIDLEDDDSTDTLLEDNVCTANEHEGIDNSATDTDLLGNKCKKNGRGVGPDIAGTGDVALGTVDAFEDNVFDTGGDSTPARLDDGLATGP